MGCGPVIGKAIAVVEQLVIAVAAAVVQINISTTYGLQWISFLDDGFFTNIGVSFFCQSILYSPRKNHRSWVKSEGPTALITFSLFLLDFYIHFALVGGDATWATRPANAHPLLINTSPLIPIRRNRLTLPCWGGPIVTFNKKVVNETQWNQMKFIGNHWNRMSSMEILWHQTLSAESIEIQELPREAYQNWMKINVSKWKLPEMPNASQFKIESKFQKTLKNKYHLLIHT